MISPSDLTDRLAAVEPVIRQHAADVDRSARFPTEAIAALGESGLMGLSLSEEAGGLGASPEQISDVLQAVASWCGSTSMVYLMHLVTASLIEQAPPASLTDELGRMATGEQLATLAFSEKGSRSHFWSPVSRAAASGDAVTIKASKSWVTSANAASIYAVSALGVEDTGPTGSEIYVHRTANGGGTITSPFVGLGLRGNDSTPVDIDIVVSTDDRLGEPNAGFGQMMGIVLPLFAIGNSAVTVGLADGALKAALGHCGAAAFEQLDSRIADLPTVRAYAAKAFGSLQAAKALLRSTAAQLSAPTETTTLDVLATKAFCNETALSVTEAALRITGGAGFSSHVPVERFHRDARAGFVMAPTSDALHEFVGRALFGMELF